MHKPKVAFICNHNSCRSQISEALGKLYASDVFDGFSAGTIIKNAINSDAVRLVKEIYGIDMALTQYNKKIEEIPSPDVVVFMGCDVACPTLKAPLMYDWALDDPSGKGDDEFIKVIKTIEIKIKELITIIKNNF